MRKNEKRNEWVLKGYEVFGLNGIDGLQVERLARVLGRNKSGFYHYFGSMDSFLKALMEQHHLRIDEMVKQMDVIKNYDPDYLNFLVNNKLTVLFNMQLIRDRHIRLFFDTYNEVSEKINRGVITLWSEETGLTVECALHFYNLIRDIFYTKVTSKNLNYEFLHQIVTEVKILIQEIQSSKIEIEEK